MWKWSREGRQNPLLHAGDDKSGYVFTKKMLELAPFAKVVSTGPDDPLNNRYCFYCILCRRNISMRTRGLYELKRHFQRDCHFKADQRLREKICPAKFRGRDGRMWCKDLFTMMFWKGNHLLSLPWKPLFVSKLVC